ncbi:MAG: T9SS type A sorting domain-containing protein [Flavobacteriales bacterium]
MKRNLLVLTFALFVVTSFSQFNIDYAFDPLEVRYMQSKSGYDLSYQQELRDQPFWKSFVEQHGMWYVHFNEKNQLPHRAFGKPIPVATDSPEQMAIDFANDQLSTWDLPVEDLVYSGIDVKNKYTWANFTQYHQGLEVLDSRYSVKFHNNSVILFACDVYKNINVNILPTITSTQAGEIALAGISDAVSEITVDAENLILPIPNGHQNTFHLVYEVMVKTLSAGNIPSHYYTLVDAHTGIVLYRQNKVAHHHSGPCKHDIPAKTPGENLPAIVIANVNGDVYPFNPYDAITNIPLPFVTITVGGTDYECDEEGHVVLPVTPGSQAQVRMMGPWCRVYANNLTPTMTNMVNDGINNLSFTGASSLQDRCSYKAVNEIHEHMKTWMPTFTGMDFQLPTNVDVAGDCNAFYDGASINFYAAGNGCNNTALISDVTYHEYGHGINDKYYQSLGGSFNNGAMGEGYADFWAISRTDDPVLGSGFYDSNEDGIRQYNAAPKVFPDDLIGEVHADGEIIMGAWYDTHLLLGGNWNTTLALFIEAYAGMQAEANNGNEGEAYTDVLIDALQADDDDGDISNGTPNGNAIAEGFDIHGITLISNATIIHDNVALASANQPLELLSELDIEFPFLPYLQGVKCFYRINNGAWQNELMNEDGSNVYTIDIEPQPAGTVLAYYFSATDVNESTAGALPIAADKEVFPNLPFFTLIGVEQIKVHDSDDNTQFGSWTAGLPADNATTGEWEQDEPMGSYTTDVNPGTMVAVDHQHTQGGSECFITGNATGEDSGIGENDVDGGKTTLQTPLIDMTLYSDPIISYWRYFTNSPPGGANPGLDYWQVRVTNNNGNSWTYIENTKTSDMSWRQNAFRVADYIAPTAQMRFQFIASDSTWIGENLDGGSLIEAAVDDFTLYDSFEVGVEENTNESGLTIYPSPASDQITLQLKNKENFEDITILNAAGQAVWTSTTNTPRNGDGSVSIDVSALAAGVYTITVKSGESKTSDTFIKK